MSNKVTPAASPQQVWERLLRNEPLFILDVRNRDEFEHWRVEGPRSVPTLNVPYFELLAAVGARIERVLDTHLHADYLSGGPALGQGDQIPYHLHPYDAIHPMNMLPARIAYRPLEAEQTFRVGSAEVRVLHFPGHTLGMVAFLIEGRYLLSGDSLFLESVARPDLGGKAEAWAPLLYDSLQRMAELPDETLVLPAHFSDIRAGDENSVFRATLGELKQRNPGLLKTLVFAGGIGENASSVRARICEGLQFLGIEFLASRSRNHVMRQMQA